mgnify:FL=1
MDITRVKCIAAALCTALLAACHSDTLYHTYLPLPSEGWQATDTLRFDLPELTDAHSGHVLVDLRVSEQIPYRLLRLVLEQRTDSIRLRDTLAIPLADHQGQWLAKGTVLHEFETESVPLRLPSQQPRQLLLYHIMSRQTMPGVTEAGVRVTKSPFLGIEGQKNIQNILENHQK